MKPLLIVAVCVVAASGSTSRCASPRQSQSLFNGRDLSGWHVDVPAIDSNVRLRSPFVVRNGMLVSLGEPRGHLITDSSYRDYRLEIEYRFPATPGNAGVLVHASTPRALYGMFPRSIEVQMEHGNAGDFWCILEDIRVPDMERRRGPPATWGTTEGKARRILNLTDNSEKPVGEWNSMVIEAAGRSIRVWVNGDLVNEGSDATADRGRIALQSEGSEIEFRKLSLAPISRQTITVSQRMHDLAREIRDSAEAWRARNHQPTGLAVGVYQHGEVILTEAIGTTRLGSTTPITPRTIFHLASVTKPFVAAAVMQLVEKGKVDIQAPLIRYLPAFRMNDPRAPSITVKQLLTHTAGMPDVTDYRWEQPEYDDASLERYVRSLADSTLVFDPGTRWQYSNIGFEVLAELIEKVSGEPFEEYMQRHIFTPLGMKHTTLLMSDVDSANLARGHVRDSAGKAVLSSVYPYNRPHAASSTLHSDLTDMLRWVAANLRKGELDGQRILSVAAIDQMWTIAYDRTPEFAKRASQSGRPMRYASIGQGLGWRVFTRQGQNLVSHSGADVGFRSDVLLWPARSSAVVVMMNDEAGDPAELSQIIYSVLLSAGGPS